MSRESAWLTDPIGCAARRGSRSSRALGGDRRRGHKRRKLETRVQSRCERAAKPGRLAILAGSGTAWRKSTAGSAAGSGKAKRVAALAADPRLRSVLDQARAIGAGKRRATRNPHTRSAYIGEHRIARPDCAASSPGRIDRKRSRRRYGDGDDLPPWRCSARSLRSSLPGRPTRPPVVACLLPPRWIRRMRVECAVDALERAHPRRRNRSRGPHRLCQNP